MAVPHSHVHSPAVLVAALVWLAVLLLGLVFLGCVVFSKSTRECWLRRPAGVPAWSGSTLDLVGLLVLSHGLGVALDLLGRAAWSHFPPEPAGANLGKTVTAVCCWTFGLNIGAILLYLRARSGRSQTSLLSLEFRRSSQIIRSAVTVLVAILPVVVVLGWGSRKLLQWIGLPIRPHVALYLIERVHSPELVALLFFCGVVLAPVGEEIMFRWGLYRFARKHGSRWSAAVLSALVFGAVHFNLALFLPVAALGFAQTILYEKTGRLAAPIALHALYNFCNFLLAYLFFQR